MGGFHVELNPLESLAFFCKLLWMPESQNNRPKLPILDTIVYHEGKPHWWLFTSRKTGEVLKKKSVRLESIAHIVDSFKKVFHSVVGHKPPDLKAKIALVWYITASGLSSYLVDEIEFSNLLGSTALEVVAVQAYIGGYSVKGNGIFEHRINKMSKNGSTKYQSLENCDPDDYEQHSIKFTAKCRQLIILEHQHELLRSMAILLIRYVEYITGAKVSQVAFQAVFNSTWTPFLVSLRAITFTQAPDIFIEARDRCIYPQGIAPVLPPLPQRSLLLPTGPEGAAEQVWKKTARPKTVLRSSTSSLFAMAQPPTQLPLATSTPTARGGTPQANTPRKDATTDPLHATRHQQTLLLADAFLQMRTAPDPAAAADGAKGAEGPTEAAGAASANQRPTRRLLRPRSAPSLAAAMVSPMRGEGQDAQPDEPCAAGSPSTRRSTPSLHVSTDTAHNRMRFEHIRALEGEDGSPKGLQSFFPQRRPISAPHVSQSKPRNDRRESPALVAVDRAGLSNTFVHKSLPLSGGQCFGDYCQFLRRIDSLVRTDSTHEDATPAPLGRAGEAAPSEARSSQCPYRIAQKSVLLARQEVRFTGLALDDKVHSWVLRLKLSQMDGGQLYAYFVRRHLNTVAQRCQEEARRLSLSSTHTPLDMWSDLNVLYRRLVYSEALGRLHPSRFYYTVPVCEACYKVYTFMDEQREALVLHSPEQSQALDAQRARRASGDAADPDDVFHRLHYGDSRPRSAQSFGPGSKMRLMRLLREKSAAVTDTTAGDVRASHSAEGLHARRPSAKSADSAASEPPPPPRQPDAVHANIARVGSTSRPPQPNAIFKQVRRVQAAEAPRPARIAVAIGADAAAETVGETASTHTALAREVSAASAAPPPPSPTPTLTTPPAAAAGVAEFTSPSSRLADIYGYATLPFEDAPRLPTKTVRPSSAPAAASKTSRGPSPSLLDMAPHSSRTADGFDRHSSHEGTAPGTSATVGQTAPLLRLEVHPDRPSEVRVVGLCANDSPSLPTIAEQSSEVFADLLRAAPLSDPLEHSHGADGEAFGLDVSTASSQLPLEVSHSLGSPELQRSVHTGNL